MAVPFHTHTFEIPTASKEDVGAASISNKVVTPASLENIVGPALSALQPAAIGTTVQGYSANLGTLAGVTPGAAGTSMLALAAAADVRSFLKTLVYVADRTALKALDISKDALFFLQEAGREGLFKYTLGNFSAQVAADTAEGMYIKADSTSASVAALVRQNDPVVAHFGGSVTSGSATVAAVSAMAALLGYVVVGRGDHLINTTSITVPLFFLEGGAFTVPVSNTLTISSRISAPKQQIFKGAGSVRSDIVNEIGEDSKVVHAAWFGVFPVGSTGSSTILTTALNNALAYFSAETREGVFELDNGSYRIDGKITVPRGIHLKGQGTRRTIFDLIGQGYTAIEAGGDAVKITGIQFEQPAGSESARTGILIDGLAYNGFVVDDVWCWGTDVGVKCGGSDARITRVAGRYNYGSNAAADSALVWICGGASAQARIHIDDVWIAGQTYSPDYVVLVGKGNVGSIQMVSVNHVMTTEKAIPVKVLADTGTIALVTVDGAIVQGDTTLTGVHLVTTGAAIINGFTISNVVCNSATTSGVQVDQGSSGNIRYGSIVSGAIYGTTGSGIILNRTAGTLSDIAIGAAFNATQRATPLLQSGTMSNIMGFNGYGDLMVQQATAAEIIAIGNAVNTKGKFAGKIVFDTTNLRLMVAAGASAGATWRVCDNSATVTPV